MWWNVVMREEFDAALLLRAAGNGAVVRQRAPVRALDQAAGHASARLADGSVVTAKVIIGADGSSGVSARHVGVRLDQVDLGLELEIAVPRAVALRSGALAGEAAAKAAAAERAEDAESSLGEYAAAIGQVLIPDMRAGRMLLSAFTRHTGTFHSGLATPKGWRVFARICRSEIAFSSLVRRPSARIALAALNRV